MIDFGFGVCLGTIDHGKLSDLRSWRNDYNIRKWCRQTGLISELSQERWYKVQNDDPSMKMYSIMYGNGDCQAGVCGLTSIDPVARRAEFSLYIAPEHQKKGIGKRALQTLLGHGFMDLNLNLIWGESFDGNPAIKMFEDMGFKREGTRRQFYFKNGKFVDAHLFSILASEWK